jgi:hypothetical protein
MPVPSILTPQGLALRQNVIYRARMLIKAPKVVATEGKVESALNEQGFVDIQFLDRDKLPGDWPPEERDDPSGMFSWTAFLQGKFTMTDRLITFKELPGTVQVLNMWEFLVPLVATPAGPGPSVPGVGPAPVLVFPTTLPGGPAELTPGQKIVGVAIGAGLVLLASSLLRGRRSVWR